MLLWSGTDSWRAEAVQLELGEDRLSATGTQLGIDPLPYRVDYELETGARWVTRRLHLTAAGEGWIRRLELGSDGSGNWQATSSSEGEVALPPPGGDLTAVSGALDCDLAYSPLTNLMPVRRHHLHRQPGTVDFLMAWVSLPDLAVHLSPQRYQHLNSNESGSRVRYTSTDSGYQADLQLDLAGLVINYPDLATRVSPAAEPFSG
ncbi:putative glycolipid-binding domain-containing protein [Kribbella qitaiheensis]|uniref:Putative glycolipid-binding domain-containing protein n=2 Tax=Kribbella qitaiheensis TaxID=1544730 RepID=A0A7G6X963_9ACTN|nr:putative glycolipid-binding domain-containing protein [Kribbella qitaiheensis]